MKNKLIVGTLACIVVVVALSGAYLFVENRRTGRNIAFNEVLFNHPYAIDHMFTLESEVEVEDFLTAIAMEYLDFNIGRIVVQFDPYIENPPEFDTPPSRVIGVYSSGRRRFFGYHGQD